MPGTTEYTTIYPYIRMVVTGNKDSDTYKDPILLGAIDFALLLMVSAGFAYTKSGEKVNPAISGNDLLLLIYRSALLLLDPEESFSYKTAVLSVTRGSGANMDRVRKMQRIEDMIYRLENNETPLAIDTSIDTYLNAITRMTDAVEELD